MAKKKKLRKKEMEEPTFTSKEGPKVVSMSIDDKVKIGNQEENTILIKKTIRSGQSVNYDGNVVVLGDVNPGGEVIASGNVVVMGALRGVVHAGAKGDESAVVTAFKLKPTQLRIANHITRSPDGDLGEPDCPEIARIREGIVVIESYQILSDKQSKVG